MKNIKYLVLWLTDDCNLECKYCYAYPVFTKNKMSFLLAKEAIKKYAEKKFTLVLAGGEPLLNFKIIEEIYKYLKEENYEVKIGLQTNATLITDKMAKKLKNMDINIGVSFDGTIQINENLRGKTKQTIQGINFLKSYNKDVSLNCVITDKNINYIENLVEFAYYMGNINGIGLDLLRITEKSIKNSILPASDISIYENLKKAYIKSKKLKKLTGKEIGIREIEEIKYREKILCENSHYCYASIGQSMVVLPNGDSYPCSSFVNDKNYYMGNVLSTIKIKKLSSGKYKYCQICEYKSICKGCCPARMEFNKNYGEEVKDCVLRKAVFKILLEEKAGIL